MPMILNQTLKVVITAHTVDTADRGAFFRLFFLAATSAVLAQNRDSSL